MTTEISDEYKLYPTIRATTLLLWGCVVVALCCGSFAVVLNWKNSELYGRFAALRNEQSKLKDKLRQADMALNQTEADLTALRARADTGQPRAAMAESRPDAVPAAPAEAITVVAPEDAIEIPGAPAETTSDPFEPVTEEVLAMRENTETEELPRTDVGVPPAKTESTKPIAETRESESLSEPVAETTGQAAELAAPVAAETNMAGEVLSCNIDRKLVMLSLGATRGLEAGKRFTIWRGKQYVGEIRVKRVFSIHSQCEVVTLTPMGIRVGDVAKIAAAHPHK